MTIKTGRGLGNIVKGLTEPEEAQLYRITKDLISSKTPDEANEKGLEYLKMFKSKGYGQIAVAELMKSVKDVTNILNQSHTDGLTGLLNKIPFREAVEKEMEKLKRYGGEGSLIYSDIDNFKKINDTWGHPTGDLIIVGVADVIKKSTRNMDIVGRDGGEEFAAYLNTGAGDAYMIAQRIKNSVLEKKFKLGNKNTNVTVSIGIACTKNPKHYDIEEFIEEADRAMYSAKKSGKNKVCINTNYYGNSE